MKIGSPKSAVRPLRDHSWPAPGRLYRTAIASTLIPPPFREGARG